MEAVGRQAEYIRDGLNYQDWQANVIKLLDAGVTVHCMCTINALCLDSLDQHLEQLVIWKKKYGRDLINYTLNILRFPSFQSPLVLSDSLRNFYQQKLVEFMVCHKGHSYLHEHEWNHLQRLVDYLDVVKTPHKEAFELPKLRNDFRMFYSQYDQRRSKNFVSTFTNLKEFYDSIPV
jgi:hypothetical protein